MRIVAENVHRRARWKSYLICTAYLNKEITIYFFRAKYKVGDTGEPSLGMDRDASREILLTTRRQSAAGLFRIGTRRLRFPPRKYVFIHKTVRRTGEDLFAFQYVHLPYIFGPDRRSLRA